MKIAIDAMGGDYGPKPIIEGAIDSAKEYGYNIILVGDESQIEDELDGRSLQGISISIQHASQVIGMDESPAVACRQKKDSSIMIATNLVKQKEVDAIVSTGNSGAIMAAALMMLQRLPNVSRPAIAALIPTANNICTILDVGANVDCKPRNLLEFAVMGDTYIRHILKKKSPPRIGLLNIGKERGKGNELALEAHRLLVESNLNFIGNIEGSDIPRGIADVIVCDGFVGNVLLKFAEGLAQVLVEFFQQEVLKKPSRKLALSMLREPMSNLKKRVDYDEYGGAPLLGINGTCIIGHGISNAKAVKNAIKIAGEFAEQNISQRIKERLDINTDSL